MIDIVYDRVKHTVNITGHAGFAVIGQDVVCSAASILAFTLASDVEKLGDNVRRVNIDLKPGDAIIKCDHIAGMKYVVTAIYDSVCTGFELLANEYPDMVRYTVKG